MHPDISYDPKIIVPIWVKLYQAYERFYQCYSGIPAETKFLIGAIFILASVGIAIVTSGVSVGTQVHLLGQATMASAMSAAAKVALVELSIGIGFSVTMWAIGSAMAGSWSINALANDIADVFFLTGVSMFISSTVNAFRYIYRSNPDPAPKVAKQYKFSSDAELDQHFSKHNKDFGYIYGNKQQYLNDANYVIKNGIYVPEMNGYLRYYGVIEKKASYAFVGMTKSGEYITTYGIRNISRLKSVPWLIL